MSAYWISVRRRAVTGNQLVQADAAEEAGGRHSRQPTGACTSKVSATPAGLGATPPNPRRTTRGRLRADRVRTRRCASTPLRVEATRGSAGTPRSSRRVIAEGASLVCRVDSTQVAGGRAARIAICGGFQVADFADHDDVRVLPQQGAHAEAAKSRSMLVCTCIWLNSGEIISIGSSTRADVDVRRGQALERGVQRGGLARTGRAGDQHDAVRAASTRPGPAVPLPIPGEAELVDALRTAASGSKMRITHFSPNAVGMVDKRISTSRPPGERVLMRPSCGRRRSARSMRPSTLIRLTTAVITAGGTSNTLCSTPSMRKRMRPMSRRGSRWMSRSALFVGVLQQPIDDMHDVLVVGVDIAGAAQLYQLFETRQPGIGIAATADIAVGAAYRAGDAEELHRVAVQVQRIGQHHLDAAAGEVLDIGQPLQRQRLAGGHQHAFGVHRQRQDAVAARIGVGDHAGHRGDVHPGRSIRR